ncbi:MAG: hypothetical protein ACFCGT_03910 [Sandaracinaceae bacterium]
MLRAGTIALVAALAYRVLAPRGLGWTLLLGAGLIALVYLSWSLRRRRGERQAAREAERFAQALLDSEVRAVRVPELRAEWVALEGRGAPVERARVGRALAELLDADGATEEALAVLDETDASTLPAAEAERTFHARALVALGGGRLERAREALDAVTPSPELEPRFRLLRGFLAVEEGRAEEALEGAVALREAVADRDVRLEARVLKAVALDALGDPGDALQVLGAIDPATRRALTLLGLPRVRRLAARSLGASEGSPSAARGEAG